METLKPKTAPIWRICVYCGSGSGINPRFTEAAQKLGSALAENDIGLVYGGGSLGLMGEVAKATLKAGGHVTGIIPDSPALYMISSSFVGVTFMLFVVAVVYDLSITVSKRVPFDQSRRRTLKIIFDITNFEN